MSYYRISNTISGQNLGTYCGSTESEAWQACATDASDPNAVRGDDILIEELEVAEWAASHETSEEIAQAIHDLYPSEPVRVWSAPTAEESEHVLGLAWSLTDEDDGDLYWGETVMKRPIHGA